jgi:hypothetical protein
MVEAVGLQVTLAMDLAEDIDHLNREQLEEHMVSLVDQVHREAHL